MLGRIVRISRLTCRVKKYLVLVTASSVLFCAFPMTSAHANSCKQVTRTLDSEAKFGKRTHQEFIEAFLSYQKNKSSDSLYWRAFNLKYELAKSDLRSANVALSRTSCFSSGQIVFIRDYYMSRKQFIDGLTPYLSQPPNKSWKYSGYAGYVSLKESLSRI